MIVAAVMTIGATAVAPASTYAGTVETQATIIDLRNVLNNQCLEILSFNNSNGAAAGMWDCWTYA